MITSIFFVKYVLKNISVDINIFSDDLSANKTAVQWKNALSCANCIAKLAVDRNISTCMRTEAIGLQSPEKTTRWYVDLGGIQSVHSIRIQFKNSSDSKYEN